MSGPPPQFRIVGGMHAKINYADDAHVIRLLAPRMRHIKMRKCKPEDEWVADLSHVMHTLSCSRPMAVRLRLVHIERMMTRKKYPEDVRAALQGAYRRMVDTGRLLYVMNLSTTDTHENLHTKPWMYNLVSRDGFFNTATARRYIFEKRRLALFWVDKPRHTHVYVIGKLKTKPSGHAPLSRATLRRINAAFNRRAAAPV